MAVSQARSAAFEILLRVECDGSYASELLHSDRYAKLTPRDHGLTTQLVMGVLRWRSLLDQRIDAASSQKIGRLDGEVLAALRLGAYQLQFLSRVPVRAAIFESVELVKGARKRSAASFVNAVLRTISKAGAQDAIAKIGESADSQALAQNAAHPRWLVERWAARHGLETARLICAYDQTVPDTAIHIYDDQPQANITNNDLTNTDLTNTDLTNTDPTNADSTNTDLTSNDKTEAELAAAGVQLTRGRMLSGARRVIAGDVTRTLPFRAGRLLIQDEASQLVALLAGRKQIVELDAANSDGRNREAASSDGANVKSASIERTNADRAILDCCAAPGGKTALLAWRNPRIKVFATELHAHRARLLKNLSRLPNIHIIAADARMLPFSRAFDRILADVPCSGTGTLARNPEIKWRLGIEDLNDLQSRQASILKSALEQLSMGGRLVYSTCSLEPEENETVVKTVLDSASKFVVVDFRHELEGLCQSGELLPECDVSSLLAGPYLRTIPGVHSTDGFFAALIERD
jgi:16S rRNA (cytosine967-C5)-methyltransferase